MNRLVIVPLSPPKSKLSTALPHSSLEPWRSAVATLHGVGDKASPCNTE